MSPSIDAVLNSRAGDRFHYLWAARRCLKMIEPNSSLQHVWVEGSSEPNEAGELVIDLEERHVDESGVESYHYYQLKHSTVRLEKETAPSELASTLKGFVDRHQSTSKKLSSAKRYYHYISNRLVNKGVKDAVADLVRGDHAPAPMVKKLSAITGLQKAEMCEFFALLSFQDQEDGYEQLEEELRYDLAHILAGTVEEGMTHRLIGLISDQALPKAKKSRTRGMIIQVDILKALGVGNMNGLFPAPAAFETLKKAFQREQHAEIAKQIIACQSGHVMIHAEGGVGKSVVAQQLQKAMPKHSFCLAYDCFGGGNYRSLSQPRHRPRDALMQMANEMAWAGLSSMLVVPDRLASPEVFKAFMQRIENACYLIAKRSPKALLVLFIDAADNAEMAAIEFNDLSFAKPLIREKLPKNCRFVFLCRTERRKLLQPPWSAVQIRLQPFSMNESMRHLKGRFPKVSLLEAKEFFRLTGGNPRVQATCLDLARGTIREMLASLGRRKLTTDKQIENQLWSAISLLREAHPIMEGDQIDSICRGLAVLPPFIPVTVLAAAAKVEPEAILSFVNDLGRPLRYTDQSVQFRDEPTETWFKKTFAASSEDISSYANALEPLAANHTYAAKCLPALWNQAGEHAKLIELALSDLYLPVDSLLDARDVRIYRLQFALKAALKAGRMVDAAKLALRAGEEMAGNDRQLQLLENNPDLMATLQDAQIVQERAYKRELKGAWNGSEEIYAASLFAWNKDFEGDASSCLRMAEQYLSRYFAELEKNSDRNNFHREELERSEIAELGWAYLGLHGATGFCQFILRWRPPDVIRDVTSIVVRRLVDSGKFSLIDAIAKHGSKSFPLILGLCDELNAVSKFPPKDCLTHVLNGFSGNEKELQETDHSSRPNPFVKALLSFAEACVHHQFPSAKIQMVVERVGTATPPNHTLTNDYNKVSRHTFARALALRAHMNGDAVPNADTLIPDPPEGTREHEDSQQERKDARTILNALMPRYELRAKLIARSTDWESSKLRNLVFPAQFNSDYDIYGQRSRIASFWDEIPVLELKILALQCGVTDEDIQQVVKATKINRAAWHSLAPRIEMARIAYRHVKLHELGAAIEEICQQNIHNINKPEGQGRDHWFIMMARAVLSHSQAEAAAYFSYAVEETKKFGDELGARWGAVSTIARAAGEQRQNLGEIAYRYSRIAELVGRSIDDEKHWSRGGVFKNLAHLHPPSAFTCLGRWMERDLGYSEYLIESLFSEVVETNMLSGYASFAASGFTTLRASKQFLKLCLQAEASKPLRQRIYDQAVWDFYQGNQLLKERQAVTDIARECSLKKDVLERLLLRMERIQSKRLPSQDLTQTPGVAQTSQGDAKVDLLAGYDLTTERGLMKAVQFAAQPRYFPEPRLEWRELMQRLPRGRELAFWDAFIAEPESSFLDLQSVADFTSRNWLTRASVARAWPSVLQKIGRRFSTALSERQCWGKCIEEYSFSEMDMKQLCAGVMQQAGNSSGLLYSSALFGFATLAIRELKPSEVREVLDFALKRFEEHLTLEFGDGVWSSWLVPPENTLTAYTGWIWASLGNPDSSIRWEATHCVRRLVELDCHAEIQSLLQWRGKAQIAAFLGKDFVFYDLQAQLHFLCGLARGALGKPERILPHVKDLFTMACKSIPHALIQWEASDLLLAVEESSPGALSPDELHQIESTRRSPFEPSPLKREEVVHSPWHQSGTHAWPESLYFDMDFRQYWMDSLCDLFGIPITEVEDLLREAAQQVLEVTCGGDFPKDARRSIWESSRGEARSTYLWHSSYPAVYSYDFYYALHSCFIVAAKLHQSMPLALRDESYWGRRGWNEWLSRHRLAQKSGYWLSDRLDPLLPHRAKKESSSSSNWLYEVQADDFYEVLTSQASIPGGLCVDGYWYEPEYSRCETISIHSAFVSPEMASSLANALRHEKDVHFCSLYGIMNTERDTVYDSLFQLTPVVDIHRNNEDGLDKFDPHACDVHWQRGRIHSLLVSEFSLSVDPLERFWHLPGQESPSMILEAWSDGRNSGRQSYARCGNRLFASLDFLRLACRTRKQSLVIEVEISRSSERDRFDDLNLTHLPASKKVFILNVNGLLQDARKNYQLG